MPIDPDIQELAYKLANQAFQFVSTTTGNPCFESVSQWSSLENAIAEPIQRLRDHAQKKKAEIERYKR
jgi:hypothetical protein